MSTAEEQSAKGSVNGQTVVRVDYGEDFTRKGTLYQTLQESQAYWDDDKKAFWIMVDTKGDVLRFLAETNRDDWSVFLTTTSRRFPRPDDPQKYRVDLWQKKIVSESGSSAGQNLFDVLGAADRSLDAAVSYTRIVHAKTGLGLSCDGERVGLSDAKGPATSWRLEEGQLGVSYYRIRTAVDCEKSARYLVLDGNGEIRIQTDDGKGLTDFWEIDIAGGSFRLAWADKERPNLSVVDGRTVTAQVLRHPEQADSWNLEPGLVDRTGWRHGLGQGGWTKCVFCTGVFWSGAPGLCMDHANRGLPHRAETRRFMVPLSDPFAQGEVTWRRCTRCSLLVDGASSFKQFDLGATAPFADPVAARPVVRKNIGVCWDGGSHEFDPAISYTLATEKDMVLHTDDATTATGGDWQRCAGCSSLVGRGSQSHCPATGKQHELPPAGAYYLRERKQASFMERLLSAAAVPFPFAQEGDPTFQAYWQAIEEIDAPLYGQMKLCGGLRESYPVLRSALFDDLKSDLIQIANRQPVGIDPQVWKDVGKQLLCEVDAAILVANYFEQIDSLWQNTFLEATWITETVQKILASERRPGKNQEVNWFEFAFSLVTAILGVMPMIGGQAKVLGELIKFIVEITEAATKLGMEFAEEAGDLEGREPLLSFEGAQYKILAKRFEQQRTDIQRVKGIILSDWGRLQAMQQRELIFSDELQRPATEAWLKAYEITLYQQLMPLRFYLVHAVVDWTRLSDEAQIRDVASKFHSYLLEKSTGADKDVLDPGAVAMAIWDSAPVKTMRKRDGASNFMFQDKTGENSDRRDHWPSEEYMRELYDSKINPRGVLEGTAGWEAMELIYAYYSAEPRSDKGEGEPRFYQTRVIEELK